MTVASEYGRRNYRKSSTSDRTKFRMVQRLNDDSKSSILVRLAIVFALIVQQSAFIDMPALSAASAANVPTDTNVLNTIVIAISFTTIGILGCFSARKIGYLASKNALTVLYIALVLSSVAWSIHPELTIRRGFGYVLSMAIAASVTVCFKEAERMKLVSASFAVSAIGSLLYVTAYPNEGIMQLGELAGTWRGVFPHKSVLGPVMAIGLFVELYVLVTSRGRLRWRFALLGLYFVLVVLSRSETALLISTAYVAATCIYLLWKRERTVAVVMAAIMVLASVLVTCVLLVDPEMVLGFLGKDTSLTGRTELWDAVFALIQSRPWLGYGYRAMWSPSDPYWILTNELVGGWGMTSAHNAFLEVTLELGAVGISVILAIVVTAFWRSIRCCAIGSAPLGWFAFVYFATTIFAGQTTETLGLNQNIFWLIFTIMFFSCGQSLQLHDAKRGRVAVAVYPDIASNKPLGNSFH